MVAIVVVVMSVVERRAERMKDERTHTHIHKDGSYCMLAQGR